MSQSSSSETHEVSIDKRDWVNPEYVREAREVPIERLLTELGYDLKREGSGRWRLSNDTSIVLRDNMWYDWAPQNGGRRGGSGIDFLMHYHKPGMTLQEAVREIHRLCMFPIDMELPSSRSISENPTIEQASVPTVSIDAAPVIDASDTEITLIPPARADNARNVIAYLNKTRGIDYEIIRVMLKNGSIYQTTINGNCCFLGFDEIGVARNAHLRGTQSNPQKRFVQDYMGSSKEYCFAMHGNPEGIVYVFESPIDALSHASLAKEAKRDWQQDTRLSLNGTSAASLLRYLLNHPTTSEIIFCLDNDETGRYATESIMDILARDWSHIRVNIELPKGKDFNDDLLELRAIPQRLGHSVASGLSV